MPAFQKALEASQSEIVPPWRRREDRTQSSDQTGGAALSASSHSGASQSAERWARKNQAPTQTTPSELVALPPGTECLLSECRGLLIFLWTTSRAFDRYPLTDTGFDDCFDFQAVREERHVVNGKAGGRASADVESSWLRVELKGMVPLGEDGEGANSVPIKSFHGTRWPKLPWILKERRLTGGPREAGGKNGVWSSPAFKTAETYAWPEPLGSADAPYYNPWASLSESQTTDRFQVVLELDVLERRKHSNNVYVTLNPSKVALKALHMRCWKEGKDDHSDLTNGYYPSSFMPDGTRLWYVADTEPHWLLDNDEPGNKRAEADSLGKEKPKRNLRKRKSQEEKETLSDLQVPPVQLDGQEVALPCLDRSMVAWKAVEKAISDLDLQNKLHKFLMKTYEAAVKAASQQLRERPGSFLLCWAEDAVGRLVQSAWKNEVLHQVSTCEEIVWCLRLMLEQGLVPSTLDASPPCTWTQNLQSHLHSVVWAKLTEGAKHKELVKEKSRVVYCRRSDSAEGPLPR
ncbi:unnamed protein product [Durusdinium trenchii]|uniref:Uncharacterized protein n=1 Tax=Durusdinium trenchii TaxID=1381693 RepID=A0ABP0SJ60_9DINO